MANDYLTELFNLEGKACSNDDHPAFTVHSWGPGRYDGYRCVCCIRCELGDTLKRVQESLAALPDACVPHASLVAAVEG